VKTGLWSVMAQDRGSSRMREVGRYQKREAVSTANYLRRYGKADRYVIRSTKGGANG
jgi:hypothetical protein